MPRFRKIYIEITNVCNLQCSFCSEVKRPKRIMEEKNFEIILDKIKDYTDVIYLHVKGEPLIHPKIIAFLNLANKYHLKVNLTTNGTLFDIFAKELGKCPALNKINFSLHCENDIPNYCEKIFENIKYLPDRITKVYRLWTLKNNELDRNSTKIVEKIQKYYNLSPETVGKIKNEQNIKIASTIYVDKDNEFAWPKISSYKSSGYCPALKTHIAILVDGTVVPCCLDSDGHINLGNIFYESLNDILSSKRLIQLKKSFQDRKPSEKLCQSCTFKEKNNCINENLVV